MSHRLIVSRRPDGTIKEVRLDGRWMNCDFQHLDDGGIQLIFDGTARHNGVGPVAAVHDVVTSWNIPQDRPTRPKLDGAPVYADGIDVTMTARDFVVRVAFNANDVVVIDGTDPSASHAALDRVEPRNGGAWAGIYSDGTEVEVTADEVRAAGCVQDAIERRSRNP